MSTEPSSIQYIQSAYINCIASHFISHCTYTAYTNFRGYFRRLCFFFSLHLFILFNCIVIVHPCPRSLGIRNVYVTERKRVKYVGNMWRLVCVKWNMKWDLYTLVDETIMYWQHEFYYEQYRRKCAHGTRHTFAIIHTGGHFKKGHYTWKGHTTNETLYTRNA